MNRALGQRLSEIIMSESPSREHQEHSKQQFSVQEIAYKEKLACMNRLSEARIETEKLLQPEVWECLSEWNEDRSQAPASCFVWIKIRLARLE